LMQGASFETFHRALRTIVKLRRKIRSRRSQRFVSTIRSIQRTSQSWVIFSINTATTTSLLYKCVLCSMRETPGINTGI
jgi:hypothetical protein